MPVTISDSRKEDSPKLTRIEAIKKAEAEIARLQFNPTDKNAVMEQYRQGKIKKLVFPLEPIIFSQKRKNSTIGAIPQSSVKFPLW